MDNEFVNNMALGSEKSEGERVSGQEERFSKVKEGLRGGAGGIILK